MTVAAGPTEAFDQHLLLLYRDEGHRRTSVGSWLRQGLERGEKIFYATVPGDESSVLGWPPGGVALTQAVRDGRFQFLPLAEFFPGGQQATLVRGALAEGYPGVRLSAQADKALSTVGEKSYHAIDLAMDELCAELPVWVLCQYDETSTDPTTLAPAIEAHLDAVEDGQMRLRRHEDHVFLSGEVDFTSAQVLHRALERICRLDGISSLVLDVSALTFIDVAGCRALASGTERFRRAGGTVVWHVTHGHMERVLILLGMNRLPGMAGL